MRPKLEEGEEIELKFSAFDWTKWGPVFNGSWDTFYFTNKRIIIKARVFGVSNSLPWDDVEYMGEARQGLKIKGTWKKKEMLIIIKSKKLDGDVIRHFLDISKDRGKDGEDPGGDEDIPSK